MGRDIARHEEVVGVRKSSGILAEVKRVRPGVAPHELNVPGHPAVKLNGKGVVVGVDGAEDFRHGAKISIRSGGRGRGKGCASRVLGHGGSHSKKWGSVRARGQRATSGDGVCGVDECGAGVDVNEVRQVAAETTQIADGDYGVVGDFAFNGQVRFVNLRKLEVFFEEHDSKPRGVGRLGCQDLWERWRAAWSGKKGERELAAGHASTGEGIVDGGIDDAAVVDTVPTADSGFAVAEDIPGKTDSWAEILLVTGETLRLRNGWIRKDRTWQHFVVIAQSQVQSETRENTPAILGEEGEVIRTERETERPKSLLVA